MVVLSADRALILDITFIEHFTVSGLCYCVCGQCLADVDKPDSSGNTALHLAVSGGKLGIAALLIAANADPDTENCGIDSNDSDVSEDSNDDDEYSGDEQTDGPVESPDNTAERERTAMTARQLAAGDDKVNAHIKNRKIEFAQ